MLDCIKQQGYALSSHLFVCAFKCVYVVYVCVLYICVHGPDCVNFQAHKGQRRMSDDFFH